MRGETSVSPPVPRVKPAPVWLNSAQRLSSIAVAGAVVVLLATRLSATLSTSTTIVGYPTFHAYNAGVLTDAYYLVAVVFPIIAVATYIAFQRTAGALGWRLGPSPNWTEDGSVDTPPAREAAKVLGRELPGAYARAGVAGAALALETVSAAGPGAAGVVAGAAAGVVLFALLVVARTTLLRSASVRLRRAGLGVNAVAAPMLVLGLIVVSATSTVRIASINTVVHYRWLPIWLLGGAALASAALVIRKLRRMPSDVASAAFERRVVVYAVVPLLLFLLIGYIPGALSSLDWFHDGEGLVPAALWGQGYLPWRDLFEIHGPLQDGLFQLTGFHAFEPSWWGSVAGQTALFIPVFAILLYLVVVRFVESSWRAVAAVAVAVVATPSYILAADLRFILWPAAVLLLWWTLERPSARRAATLAAGLMLQAIVTPEATYCLGACGLTILLYELWNRTSGKPLLRSFRRTAGFAAGTATALAVFVAGLAATGSLSAYALYWATVVPGHGLTGGIPPSTDGQSPLYLYMLCSALAAVLLTIWSLLFTLMRRRALQITDWMSFALLVFAGVYFAKFLERPDLPHMFEGYVAAMPLIFVLGARVLDGIESRAAGIGRLAWPRPLRGMTFTRPIWTAALIAVVALTLTARLGELSIQTRFHATVSRSPAIPLVGYAQPGAVDVAAYQDLQQVVGAYLRPGDGVFDFTNAPAMYYYVLGIKPQVRDYHVDFAIPENAQDALVSELKAHPPLLVIMDNRTYGLKAAWDGITNMVRHYDVAQWLLDNYVPLLRVHSQLIYARASAHLTPAPAMALHLHQPVVTANLPYPTYACTWLYAPSFLAISPPVRETGATGPTTLGLIPWRTWESGVLVNRIVVPAGTALASYRWLEIDSAQPLRSDGWGVTDVQNTRFDHAVFFKTGAQPATSSYRIPIGSCMQWHAYSGQQLFLEHLAPQGPLTVRLLP
jgi:hypothetical protein